MCMNVRLVDVYGCETLCIYGWFYMLMEMRLE
jgi:hypothetical protein